MNVIASFAALLVVALGYGVIVPLAPALIERTMGQATAQAVSFHTGTLSAVYLLAFAALAPLWGRAVDTSSRRLIASAGLAGFASAFAAIATIKSMGLIYLALAVAGACAAAVVPAIQVQIGRVRDDVAKARLLAGLGAASFAGSFLGPPLASWGISLGKGEGIVSAALPLGLVAILGFSVSLFVRYALPPDSAPVNDGQEESESHALKQRAWLFALLTMAVTFGIGGFEVSLVLWVVQVMRLDAGVVSRMLIECAVVMMVVQVVMFLLPAARPRWKPVVAGGVFGAMAGAVALTPFASGAWVVFAAVAVIAAAATLLQAMLSYGTVTSSGSRVGTAIGLQLSLSSVGQGLGSFGAGAFFSPAGNGFFVFAAFLLAAGLYAAVAQTQLEGSSDSTLKS